MTVVYTCCRFWRSSVCGLLVGSWGDLLIHRYKADVKKSTEKAAAKLQRDVGTPKTKRDDVDTV